MCIIGQTPVDLLGQEMAAREKARRDWAYQDEMRRLKKLAREAEDREDGW